MSLKRNTFRGLVANIARTNKICEFLSYFFSGKELSIGKVVTDIEMYSSFPSFSFREFSCVLSSPLT